MTEESLFLAALEHQDPEARQAFLRQACGDDDALFRRVVQLLAAYAVGQQKLEPPTGQPATEAHRGAVVAGTVIAGRYRLVERIGEGGMGEVWVAKQTEPVQRKVALKLIRADRDSRQVVARFEAERQALALMDHPNIARVLDGGTTAGEPGGVSPGRPFFVMELVNGLPLTKFCDEAKLPLRQRLELFAGVCQAVQHAHTKGIIHRDLKPSNILVTLYDGRPVPKIIDFGVAKAIGGRLTDESLATQFGAVVGTFEYMAPEQAGFSALDVDTRADVYSLGVLLYELLTGLRPFDSKRLRKAALDELVRILREEEPPKPSTRLSTDESAPSLASLRQTDVKRLTALVRGELDWVVMRCLEKDRNRRYETANGLARDVQRYLADEVVEARPPSAGYRLRKFARKHRAALATAAAIVALLVTGIVGTTVGLIRARAAEQDAVRAQVVEAEQRLLAEANAEKARLAATAEKAAREAAEARAAETEAVLVFIDDAIVGHGERTVLQAFMDVLPEVGDYFPSQPLVEARLRRTFGRLLFLQGKDEQALQQFQRLYDLRKTHLGPVNPITVDAIDDLARIYFALGRRDEAIKLREETLALCRAKLGLDNYVTLTCMDKLAAGYNNQGRYAEALKLGEETLARRKATLGRSHAETLHSLNEVAWMLATSPDDKLRNPRRAVELATQAVAGAAKNHGFRNTLGTARYRAGDWKGAIADLEQAIGLLKPDDPRRPYDGFFLAMAHWQLGEKDKARSWFDKSAAWMAKGKKDNPDLKRFRAEAAELLGVED